MAAGDIFQAELTFSQKEHLDEALRDPEIDFGCRVHVRQNEDGSITTVAFLTEEKARTLETRFQARTNLSLNVSEQARNTPPTTFQGDRFEGGRIAPVGLGKKI
jgi:hypothetical protein